jgi:glyoxylase-like metal-dependent hydrolase (beta-lactamase superfamily II)
MSTLMGDIQPRMMGDDQLPLPAPDQVYVKASALNGGFLTLPERNFVSDPDMTKGTTVPSMCFLIEHPNHHQGTTTRVVFDLGIKRDLTGYRQPATRHHITTRQPVYSSPDVRSSLLNGGIDPSERGSVDYVIVSHIHWDHVGQPSDYPHSQFVVGSGTLHVLEHGAAPGYPSERIERGALPVSQTVELPPTPDAAGDRKQMAASGQRQTRHTWQSLSALPNALDFFGDGSFYVIDAPGHIHGHVNVLLRVAAGKWVYLGGDCCHDRRIITGEKEIGQFDDGHGRLKSAHAELPKARKTIENIQRLIKANGEDTVEWIVAHDWEWASQNQHRFFPNWMY